jgi:hypothetical protein
MLKSLRCDSLKRRRISLTPLRRFRRSKSARKRPATPKLDSLIISSFPPLFDEFRGKRFVLLWRGSGDGFGARDLHGRCDGHANTLTLILDTGENLFGGFTPLQWESRVWNGKSGDAKNCWKCDERLKSFLFTLKKPHNIPARKFALKAAMRQWAIVYNSS